MDTVYVPADKAEVTISCSNRYEESEVVSNDLHFEPDMNADNTDYFKHSLSNH